MLPAPYILTNDDGIDAPGIRALREAVGGGLMVAPVGPQSGCSHLTTVSDAILVEARDEGFFAIHGTPADCVRLALAELHPETKFVLSGINCGGNVGHDIYLSGTVAAAREAAFHRIPAIALSQYIRPEFKLDWQETARLARRAIERVLEEPLAPGEYWNINLPHREPGSGEPDLVLCPPCSQALSILYDKDETGYRYQRGHYHTRRRDPGSDVDVCFGGNIAITRLSVQLR